jgi:hypothetical protein
LERFLKRNKLLTDWVIYYDDGTSFSSDDGDPSRAPKEGVQVVACADVGTGKLLWHSAEAYCWHIEGEWVPHSETGLRRYLALSAEGKEAGLYIRGYAIPYRRFVEIYNKAVADSRLPFKTGRDHREPETPTQ